MHDSRPIYVATTSRIARFDLLIENLEERVIQLEKEDSQKTEALKRSMEATRQFARIGQDKKLAGALWHALDTTPPTVGFIYLKRWTMPDVTCWFKIGITNNPDRRETEQNVLPVAAESIVCVDVGCPASTPLADSRQSSWPVRAPRLSPATTWGRRHEK
jgi:hypothetical protein